jgi:hypothetical protein
MPCGERNSREGYDENAWNHAQKSVGTYIRFVVGLATRHQPSLPFKMRIHHNVIPRSPQPIYTTVKERLLCTQEASRTADTLIEAHSHICITERKNLWLLSFVFSSLRELGMDGTPINNTKLNCGANLALQTLIACLVSTLNGDLQFSFKTEAMMWKPRQPLGIMVPI